MKKSEKFLLILLGVLGVGGLLVVYFAGSTFTPVVIALILAYLLDPLVALLVKRRVNRSLAIVIVFFTFLALFGILGVWVVGSFIREFQGVQINLQAYAARLYEFIPSAIKTFFDIETEQKLYQQIDNGLAQLRGVSFDLVRESFAVVQRAFTSTLAFILTLLGYFITPVYLFYFLKDLPKIRDGVLQLVPERYRGNFLGKTGEIGEVLAAFVRGQLSLCFILAILYSIGLYFIGIDLAVVIGTFAGLAYIIPYLGTIVGIVLSMIMAVLKFHDLAHPLLCLGWFLLVQGIEGTVITPRLVGHKVGLHPVVTILAILLGGQFFGLIGILLAVPVTAVLNVFFRSLLDNYRHSSYYSGS
jgi:predicted PurR-regulated permease PerM